VDLTLDATPPVKPRSSRSHSKIRKTPPRRWERRNRVDFRS